MAHDQNRKPKTFAFGFEQALRWFAPSSGRSFQRRIMIYGER